MDALDKSIKEQATNSNSESMSRNLIIPNHINLRVLNPFRNDTICYSPLLTADKRGFNSGEKKHSF
jgi:hypothetical protein